MNTVIILPTYNEKGNIVKLINSLMTEFDFIEQSTNFRMHILVVDDNSPDGTGDIVRNIVNRNKKVSLITGDKKGLGNAYLRGFNHAIHSINADVVMEMDADFSHDPKDIKRLIAPLTHDFDFVIGSRYIKGGSIPKDWSLIRKLNSRFGNIFARYVAGIYYIHDCTAGFRAIKVSLLKKMALQQLKVDGYSFQMNLLHLALQENAKVKEVPVDFVDRQFGESKISMKDIREFIKNSLMIRFLMTKKKIFQQSMVVLVKARTARNYSKDLLS